MTNGSSPVSLEATSSGIGDVKKLRRKSSSMWALGGGGSAKSGMDLSSSPYGYTAASGGSALAFAMQRETGGAGLEVKTKSSMQRLREMAGMTGMREG